MSRFRSHDRADPPRAGTTVREEGGPAGSPRPPGWQPSNRNPTTGPLRPQGRLWAHTARRTRVALVITLRNTNRCFSTPSMLADRPPASSSLDETIWRAACKPAAQPISVEIRTGASISRPRLCIERAHRALSWADAHDATPRGASASSALPGTWPYTAEMGHSEGGFRAGGR